MKVFFAGALGYEGPSRHIYRVIEIYKAIGRIFEIVGIDARYCINDNSSLPLHKTISPDELTNTLADYDLGFIWNGQLARSKELSKQCRLLGIPVYFSELGWLPQNGTFFFDRKGVNYESSILDWRFFPLKREEQLEAASLISYYHKILSRRTGVEESNFVFVPFQVEDDSQIINHSHKIKKMQQLVDYVCAFESDRIIFKTHPKHKIEGIKYPANCKLYNSGTTHDFLPACKYVITINSTVGVEALTYFKPVINLGNAFYEGRRLTYKANNDDEFRNAINWAREGRVSIGVIEAFLYYLFKRQWYTTYLDDPDRVLTLIEGITDRRQNEP